MVDNARNLTEDSSFIYLARKPPKKKKNTQKIFGMGTFFWVNSARNILRCYLILILGK